MACAIVAKAFFQLCTSDGGGELFETGGLLTPKADLSKLRMVQISLRQSRSRRLGMLFASTMNSQIKIIDDFRHSAFICDHMLIFNCPVGRLSPYGGRPGQSRITTPRKETDTCSILSGLSEGQTTGTPIAVLVPNTDQRGQDYSEMSLAYRPSHADATYDFKYGVRSVQVLAYVSQVHKVTVPDGIINQETLTLDQIESNIARCPDPVYAEKMIDAIDAVRTKGDSVGGVVTCIVRNVPKPFTIGTLMTGSEHNDEFYMDDMGEIRTRTNRSGGIQGGISNGETIILRVAFKPTSTITKKQMTVTRGRQETELQARGRHDPCVVPRAVPMVEAMVALVLADQLMQQYAQCELLPINKLLQDSLDVQKTIPTEVANQ